MSSINRYAAGFRWCGYNVRLLTTSEHLCKLGVMCLLFLSSLSFLGFKAIHLPPAAMFYITQCCYHDPPCCYDSLLAQDPLSMAPAA